VNAIARGRSAAEVECEFDEARPSSTCVMQEAKALNEIVIRGKPRTRILVHICRGNRPAVLTVLLTVGLGHAVHNKKRSNTG
jgi:methionine synthase II (cobalamin-independent)